MKSSDGVSPDFNTENTLLFLITLRLLYSNKKKKGERVASLESTTAGTMISVFTKELVATNKDIEMIINLKDGAEKKK